MTPDESDLMEEMMKREVELQQCLAEAYNYVELHYKSSAPSFGIAAKKLMERIEKVLAK